MKLNTKEFLVVLLIILLIFIGKNYDNKVRNEAMYKAIINAEKYEEERQLEVYNRVIE